MVSCTWCTVLDWRDSGPEEARSTVSSFHSTHHCSLQHCTPRNNNCIVPRKWEYFHFCYFQVSIFAHPPVGLCNGVGKTSSNINDCCLLVAQTWAALVVFGDNSSLLTSGIFLSQCCPAVTPEQSHHHLLQKKILNTGGVNKMHISIHSYSEDGITRQLVTTSKWSWRATLSQTPCLFEVLPSECGSQRTVFLPLKLIKNPLIYWPIL